MKEKLSKNFALAEMTKTCSGLQNVPDIQHVINLTAVAVMVLEPLRAYINSPIIVTSGFRSPLVNSYVLGALKSQHMQGQAVDFVCKDMAAAFHYIEDNLMYDQLIWEKGNAKQPAWIHVSYTSIGTNRMETIYAYNK